jgi:methionine-rich copper-binding protein CopC
MNTQRFIAALACAGALMLPGYAQAHAHLDHAKPAVGSTVTAAPKEVTLWFTEALEPKFSTIEVHDAEGKAMQAGPAKPVPGNTAQLQVSLKALTPGTYTVIWHALSVDTHRSQGTFTFKVGR